MKGLPRGCFNATDSASHTTSKVYTVNSGGSAANFTYDANGDRLTGTTDPGIGLAVEANYTWDSVGRLLAVTKP